MSEKFTQSFEQFSSGLGTTDVLLYAGVALFLWYLFRDKMGGIKDVVTNLISSYTRIQKPNKIIIPAPVSSPKAVGGSLSFIIRIFIKLKNTLIGN